MKAMISIFGLKLEVPYEAIKSFIVRFELHAINANMDTEIKLYPLESWHCSVKIEKHYYKGYIETKHLFMLIIQKEMKKNKTLNSKQYIS